ncbi:MAG: amidohydrolase [bacterium]|nr:amidohydrolase [bacterium]
MRRSSVFLAIIIFLSGCQSLSNQPAATIILTGGTIITQNPAQPSASALALNGNRILKVGDDKSVIPFAGPDTRTIDLKGAVVVPGFSDSHCHLYGLGKALSEINLNGTATQAEVAERVAKAHSELPGTSWLQGRGWDQNDWPIQEYPTKNLLDPIVNDRPVLIRRVDGHAALANSKALELAGIDKSTPDPEGGQILRDEKGQPTGLLIDNGVDLVRRIIPAPSTAEIARRVKLAIEHCHRFGITGVHEAGVSWERVKYYSMLAGAGNLDLRIYGLLDDVPETLEAGFKHGPLHTPDQILTVRAIKLYADGALGSRGARLLEDYCDHPGHRGLFVTDAEHMRATAKAATEAGFQVGSHAIGDEANRLMLDIFQELNQTLHLEDPRWRIEHSQILSLADIPRFAELGVIAAMQPVHCTSDMDWADERLCTNRLAGAYAWKSLLKSGAHICFGTDFPVERVDPLAGLYAARTRTHPNGEPQGGWQAQEILDGATALELYTIGSAYAAFMEDHLGKIEEGFLADLTVLEGNPVTCDPRDLLTMKVKMTVVAGKIVYQAP